MAKDIEFGLSQPYYTQAGIHLRKLGYVCVAIDLPSHGEEVLDPADVEIDGWRGESGKDSTSSPSSTPARRMSSTS